MEDTPQSVQELVEQADDRTRKRAQWEAFEFSVDGGVVTVRNCSHENPSDHEYQVKVENGVPVACTCEGFTYDATTKHLLAVALREPVLQAAKASQQRVATDGGQSDGV